jgi:N,N-dimethylformamidase beta subunit-like, C-terminal
LKNKNFRFYQLDFLNLTYPLLILFSLFTFSSILSSSLPIKYVDAELGLKIQSSDKKIGFVEPTFTYAAYNNNSFYNFYAKYSPKIQFSPNLTIYSDLNLLKNKPVPHERFWYFNDPSSPTIPYKEYFDLLLDHFKKFDPNITNLTDADVHHGKIFQSNGKNLYDALFLFHNEYVTQSEYNNLKQFVINGGTLIFTEANSLFAEVSYDDKNDTITLVKGHYWKVDENTAKNSTGERWLNENKEWRGSNYLDITNKIFYKNNPFNYSHVEEDFVSNPKAKILLDYQAYDLPEKYANATVATYEMNYGKGKIISLGIWGHQLINNEQFLKYLDNDLIPLSLNLTKLPHFNIKELKPI